MKNHSIILTLLLSFCVAGFALTTQNKDSLAAPNADTPFPEAEVVSYMNHLDSFVIATFYSELFKRDIQLENELNEVSLIRDLPDSVYEKGLSELNRKTPFDLAYNPYTRAFIELYLYKKKDLTERCMGLSSYYFPVFEELLDKYDLPIEFKYLAIVESALNVSARSRAGAGGLWQFMYRTGKYYGLEINSYVDERYELYAATDAACRYFKDLYAIYGNWELVIAAYNCGPGNVNKAIRRSGGKRTYWEIRAWLPRETRGYVPAFIAVNYAMNYGHEQGLIPQYPDTLNLMTDTLCLKMALDFEDVCNYFCVNPAEMKYLNPSYRRASFPDDGNAYTLRLPIAVMNQFIEERDEFEEYISTGPVEVAEESVTAKAFNRPAGEEQIHVVRRGEVLGVIAERYGCSVRQVMDWNNLYTSRINEGQKLVLYSSRKPAPAVVKTVVKPAPATPSGLGDARYHIVRPGDTLWDIANMYEGVTVAELKRLNKDLNHKRLKPGDKIMVSSNG